MQKRGLELSINFIVVLVLAIVTLVMGIIIFNIIFRSGTELEREVSQRTKDQINRLLMTGDQKIAMPDFFKEIEAGDQHAFGLGIRNYRSTSQQFTIYVEFDMAVDKQNTDRTAEAVANHEIEKWYFEETGPYAITQNELEVISVPIRVGNKAKNSWIYVFNVVVADQDNMQYGSLQKIYIKVR
ncbi:hypothetical protein KY312_02630 [Candidatus Woesearchaeota archaeon]|nr:hypothetical protein [Candidatus Woesearchaeota archaeon]